MNHRQVEIDICHLESVVNRTGSRHGLSLSYWRGRVDLVMALDLVPSQRIRANRISAALAVFEAAVPDIRPVF